MPTGRVRFFNTDRGFVFILPDDGGPDVFVHVHDVETAGMKTLVAGQVLAYNTTARDGRLTLTLQTFASVRASFASIGQQELNPCDRNSLPFLGGVPHN
jgi:CspA family cold shock protein